MRIFKHRGDIYIPSANVKDDKEKRLLFAGLCFVVMFTVVFVGVLGIKYNFSIKNFFTPDNLEVATDDTTPQLPEVSGKTNFLFALTNENTGELYFCSLYQVDLDTVSYKATTLSAQTKTENGTLQLVYDTGGAGAVVKSLNSLLGIDIDYYVDENLSGYKDMFNAMGKINYTVLSDVKYKDTSRYGYNIKIKAGEQSFDGESAEKLMRYYIEQEQNYSAVNDILLAQISQQINSENYAKQEVLFSKFIQNSQTDITVKDFTQANNGLQVLSSETTGVNIYSVAPVYEDTALTPASVKEIQGYFTK